MHHVQYKLKVNISIAELALVEAVLKSFVFILLQVRAVVWYMPWTKRSGQI